MYYLYILKSLNYPKTYVGITNEVDRRLFEHNSGYSLFSKRYMPWAILNLEEFGDRNAARVREKYYKSAAGRRKLKKLFLLPLFWLLRWM